MIDKKAKTARPLNAPLLRMSNDHAVLLQMVDFHATGALCQSTVAHLRDALAEDEGSITLMQDVQALMHRYYRANTKIKNAVLTLSRALDLEAD